MPMATLKSVISTDIQILSDRHINVLMDFCKTVNIVTVKTMSLESINKHSETPTQTCTLNLLLTAFCIENLQHLYTAKLQFK